MRSTLVFCFSLLTALSLPTLAQQHLGMSAPPTNQASEDMADAHPNPSLSPKDVVRIQTQALLTNDETDQGIEIAFRFAAPNNKRLTGPLNRFTQLIKGGMYRHMLNAREITYQDEFEGPTMAAFTVTVRDQFDAAHDYMFVLRKQMFGPLAGCWMTESVFSKPRPPLPKPIPS